MEPFLDSTDASSDGADLRGRLDLDGYLFLRQVIPAPVLEDLRLKLLAIARDGGWVRPNAPLEQALADPAGFCVEPEPRYMNVYHQMYRQPELHAAQHHPHLIGIFERIFDAPIMPHPRIIGRTIFPQRDEFTTPPHQDFIPIQGTSDTYTAWIPLSDVPPELGGLELCSGSHRHGIYEFRPALGAGGLEIIDLPSDGWVSGPMKQGDVLVFHSHTIHKGLPNRTERLRMSLDTRFQKVSDPIAADSLEPHGKLISWEQVYADWPSLDLQWYWRKWSLTIQPYDMQYHERRDRMAFEMAEAGDRRARSTLQRIIARDTDSEKRARAERLLTRFDPQEPVK